MRRYQKRLVNELATHYQSKDPLKWVFIAIKLDVDRWPTDRERKLFSRRVVRTVERTAEQVVAGMAAFALAVTQAAGSFKTLADNMKLAAREEESE